MRNFEKFSKGIDKIFEILLGIVAIGMGIMATFACVEFIYGFENQRDKLDSNGWILLMIGTAGVVASAASGIIAYLNYKEHEKQYQEMQKKQKEFDRKIGDYLEELKKRTPPTNQ